MLKVGMRNCSICACGFRNKQRISNEAQVMAYGEPERERERERESERERERRERERKRARANAKEQEPVGEFY